MTTTTPTSEQSADDERHELFVTLFGAAHRLLLAYLMSLLGHRHDAEDVLQRASIIMWRRFDSFEAGSDFLAWASTVAFYEAKNFQRVSARSRMHFSDELLQTLAMERLPDLVHSEPRRVALQTCLQKLNESQRELVKAVYFDGSDGSDHRNVATLAAKLGRAPQTLYNKLNLIRRTLAECVTRRMAEGSS